MSTYSKHLVPAVAAALMFASGITANYVSQAEEAILIPGAMPFKQINPLYPSVAATYPDIGIHFRGDSPSQLIEYSQDPFASNKALRDGVKQTLIAAGHTDGDLVIIGESMGSMVAWRAAEELAGSPEAPAGNVKVVLIAPPEVGVAEYFKEGTYIPVLNYRITRIRESGYETTIVIGEYDGWSDPPDRPWNLISSANALAGIAYVHGPTSFTADPEDVPAQNKTTSPSGLVTTYLVPTENLPLTQVFRDVGVPDALVDKADDVLRPVVDAGYVRHDAPGDTRPYLRDGKIQRNVQNQQQARASLHERVEKARAAGQERRESRNEQRQAIRKDLRDRVDAGLGQLKKKITERQAARHVDRQTSPE